jgi:hypothetical protein
VIVIRAIAAGRFQRGAHPGATVGRLAVGLTRTLVVQRAVFAQRDGACHGLPAGGRLALQQLCARLAAQFVSASLDLGAVVGDAPRFDRGLDLAKAVFHPRLEQLHAILPCQEQIPHRPDAAQVGLTDRLGEQLRHVRQRHRSARIVVVPAQRDHWVTATVRRRAACQ